MRSTMQDAPLSIATIIRYGSTVHAGSEVVSWTGGPSPRRTSYAEIGREAARLAHALRGLGIDGDQRVDGHDGLWRSAHDLAPRASAA